MLFSVLITGVTGSYLKIMNYNTSVANVILLTSVLLIVPLIYFGINLYKEQRN